MKVKVFAENGETHQDLEDKLEKAVKAKRKKREKAYARESYQNDHFDQFHDMITEEHQNIVKNTMEEVSELLRLHLGVGRVGQ